MCCSLLCSSGFDSVPEVRQATSKGIGEDVLHHMAHVCNLLLVVEEALHDRLHVVCWPFLVELLPVDEKMRRLHVDGEGEVRCVPDSWHNASISVKLMEIPDNDGPITRSCVQVLESCV
jgi:hypothetical protein